MRFLTASANAPLIALVGRPNVGKSTLFNRLVRRRQALMHDEPGVTRDRLFGAFTVEDVDNRAHALRLVDTGGLVAPGDDALAGAMMAQTHMAIEEAALVLLVVDARAGLMPADADAARVLHKAGTPFVLVVNKVDLFSHEALVNEFYSLGAQDLIGISAEHARNIDEVRDCISARLAADELLQEDTLWHPDLATANWRAFGTDLEDEQQATVEEPAAPVGPTKASIKKAKRAAALAREDAILYGTDADFDDNDPAGQDGDEGAPRFLSGEADGDQDAHIEADEDNDNDGDGPDNDNDNHNDNASAGADTDDFDAVFGDEAGDTETDLDDAPASPCSIEWGGGPIQVAVVGRPNAGKSSLINAILGEERLVASPEAGTTRDTVDTHIEIEGQPYVFVDTAGIRRQRNVKTRLEGLMVHMARASLQRADVVVLVLDATERPSDQDCKIAAMAHDRGCGLVLVANKWDLIENPEWRDQFEPAVRHDMPFVSYAPVVRTSAKTGAGLHDLFAAVVQTQQERHRRVGTGALNRFFREVVDSHPPPFRAGSRPQLTFVSQPMVRPPTFVVAAKRASSLAESYRRYLINALRDRFGFAGTPLWLKFRSPPKRARRGGPASTTGGNPSRTRR